MAKPKPKQAENGEKAVVPKSLTLQEICNRVDGILKGDPDFCIRTVNSLDSAGQDEIAFSIRSSIDLNRITAGALIVAKNSPLQYPNLIYVDEPYMAFAVLLNIFFPDQPFCRDIHHLAFIAPSARIGEDVAIGPFTYIGEDTVIGDSCEIHANVTIYRGVTLGKNCLIYANVVIREDVEIGDGVIIQPGAVIGADGFGFTRLRDGTPIKIPQKGKVKIGNHCEIGANTCIDRSTIEKTVLGDYVKADNLVQIGHNVSIGRGTAISALCGISGSSTIGENVIMGGQVGIADHTEITDNVMIAAKTGVHGHVKKKGVIAGIPHQELSLWKKNQAIFKNLESYIERIKNLEKKIKEMEDKSK